MPFQLVNELLSQLAKPSVLGVFLGEVDLPPLPGTPGFLLGAGGGGDLLLGRIDDDLAQVGRTGLGDVAGVQDRCGRQFLQEAGMLIQETSTSVASRP